MKLIALLALLAGLLLGGVSAIYAHRVARLVPFARDYGVPAHIRYQVGRIPIPFTYIDVGHRDCPEWIRQEYRYHRGVSVAALAFSIACMALVAAIARLAGA